MKGLDNQLGYDSCVSNDDIKDGFYIMNSLQDDESSDEDLYQDEDVYENYDDCESCTTCYYSDGKYCFLKNIYINKYFPLCWGYRDSLTMRASSNFQDDDYDLD